MPAIMQLPAATATLPQVQNATSVSPNLPISGVSASSVTLSTPSAVSNQQSTDARTLNTSAFIAKLGIKVNPSTISASSAKPQTSIENSVTAQGPVRATDSYPVDAFFARLEPKRPTIAVTGAHLIDPFFARQEPEND